MKRIPIKIFVFIMNLFYFFIKLSPVKKNRITFISRESNTETLDFSLLRKELENRGYEVAGLYKRLDSKPAYFFHIFKQMRAISTSELVILDTYSIAVSILKHKKSLKIIQMWHAAAAIKKFGLQTLGMEDGRDPIVASSMHMHENYDYIIAPGSITAKHFSEAFGYNASKISINGLPRLEYLLEEDVETESKINEKYPFLSNGEKTILYAPTFRKQYKVHIKALLENLDRSKYNIIIKLHPLDKKDYSDIQEGRNIAFDYEFDIYDLIKSCDILISDYSSLIVEGTVREIPIYLFCYDYDEYSETTGLNIELKKEAIGKCLFENSENINELLSVPYDMEALKGFRSKYIEIDCNNAIKNLGDFIESII